ncbi:hypothetical protein ACCO45_011359 [Purpureocillium lilacinum]|uniref:Uncharacterized protein n=1 Tax=Purpureocillium lilacinum TaxID=33203 RepID=A0ACC4DK08_PURLI
MWSLSASPYARPLADEYAEWSAEGYSRRSYDGDASLLERRRPTSVEDLASGGGGGMVTDSGTSRLLELLPARRSEVLRRELCTLPARW